MVTNAMLWSALAAFLLSATQALAGESVASAEPFEINAVRSQAGRYDYVAKVFGNTWGACTGTLISENVLMTAAHCFGYDRVQNLIINASVTFGYDLPQPTAFPATPSTAIAIHPLYSQGQHKYDIALMRIDLKHYTGPPPTFLPTPIRHLAQDVVDGDRLVCYSHAAPISNADYNKTVVDLGWGNTDPTDRNSTLFLRNLNLTLTDPNDPMCQGFPVDNSLQDNTGFCMIGAFPNAQELPTLAPPSFPGWRKAVCYGDSGGPTIFQGPTAADDVLIGVNSHLLANASDNFYCGNPALGDVSTSVGSYTGFVQSVLHEFQDNGLPIVNITGMAVSQVGYGSHGFGKSGQVTFLVTLNVQTNYLMERIGVYDLYNGPLPQPGFALRASGLGHNITTVLPFKIASFDAPSFTYTLEAINYQVVADFTENYLGGQVRFDTGLQVLFRAFSQDEYAAVVAEVSAQQLKAALCANLGAPGSLGALVTAMFQPFCSIV